LRYSRYWTILFIILLPVVLIAFKNRMYQVTLIIMVIQLLSNLFIASDKLRTTVWSLTVFQFCYFILLYGYRIIESLSLSISLTVLLGECLQLIPIIGIIYIQKKFEQDSKIGFTWPRLKNKKLYLGNGILLLMTVIIISTSFISLEHLWLVFSYCILHAVLFEILWRGLVLNCFAHLLNPFWVTIVVSTSFSIYCYSYGYPLNIVLTLGIISVVLSYLKMKTNSILPSILLHFNVILFFYLSGSLYIPI
jgi:uncharacterized protein